VFGISTIFFARIISMALTLNVRHVRQAHTLCWIKLVSTFKWYNV